MIGSRLITLALTIGLANCGGDGVRTVVERLYKVTTPEGVSASTLVYNRAADMVEASWELSTNMSWDLYLKYVEPDISREGFTAVEAIASGITFRRALDGDVQLLALTARAERGSVRVRASFTSMPF